MSYLFSYIKLKFIVVTDSIAQSKVDIGNKI
jgi:hypothetical protein